MSDEWKEITIKKPRKTFILGLLHLKCRSTRFKSQSDHVMSEAYMIDRPLVVKLNIQYESQDIRRNQNSWKLKHKNAQIDCKVILPDSLNCQVSEDHYYTLRLVEPRFIKPPEIYNVIVEQGTSYATYEGLVVGYLYDTVEVIKRVKVIPPKRKVRILASGKPNEKVNLNGKVYSTPCEVELETGEYLLSIDKSSFVESGKTYFFKSWSDGVPLSTRTVKISGNKTIRPIYEERHSSSSSNDNDNSNRNDGTSLFSGCLSFIGWTIVLGLILFLVVVPLISLGSGIIPFILIIGVILFFIRFGFVIISGISTALRWIGPIIGVILLGFFIAGLLKKPSIRESKAKDTKKEVKRFKPIEVDKKDPLNENDVVFDTIISQYREWEDYNGNKFSTEVKTYLDDVKAINQYRNQYASVTSFSDFNELYLDLVNFGVGRSSFDLLYQNLDTIRVSRNLDRLQFAEMVVSMVQDVPYVLILPNECNHQQYSDMYVREYLLSDQPCTPFVKNGLYSPEEFAATLEGDCDTRTLFLFRVLAHYDYDVRIFNNENIGHSILGVNLGQMIGHTKVSDNLPYTLWETTAFGLKPGAYTPFIKNLNNWKTAIYIDYDN